jgi:hypothetical protein
MENGIPPVRVLGIGHLAAAVRVHLQQLRPFASHMDCWINSESAALFLACSDFENTALRRSLAARARADGTTLLFACLEGHRARLGPLITPLSRDTLCSHYLTRSWDFSRTDTRHRFVRIGELPPHLPDTTQTHLAQIGATFIIGELANLLLGFHDVTKIDSPTNLSQCPPQVFPETHPGTLVVSSAWREQSHLPTRTWHPTGI